MDIKKSDFLNKIKNKMKPRTVEEESSTVENKVVVQEESATSTAIENTVDNKEEDIKTMFYSMAPVDVYDADDNIIVGEKTGATMNASVMMEREGDENGRVKSDEENLPDYGTNHFSAPMPVEDDVVFGGDALEGATVADDIIETAPQFDIKPIVIEDIETIDIDIPENNNENSEVPFALADEEFDEEEYKQESLEELIQKENLPPLPKHEEEKEIDSFEYEKLFGKQQPVPKGTTQVSKVPVYRPDSSVEKLNVNVGKFSVVVRQEYEEYLKSKNPEISATYQPTQTVVTEEIYKNKTGFVDKVMEFFASDPDGEQEEKTTAEKVVTVDDYDNSDDTDSVKDEIKSNLNKLHFQCFALGVLTAFSVVMMFIQSVLPVNLGANLVVPLIFAVLNLIMIASAGFVYRVSIRNGLMKLRHFKGNSDTAVSVGLFGAGLSAIAGLFVSQSYFTGRYNYYTVIVLLAMFCNAVGKLLMVKRVEKNFDFLTSNNNLSSAKIYTDENIASKMMSGTVIEKPIIAYQHKTGFLTNYLQLSYAPDPSEEVAGKIVPFTTVCSILVAVLFGFISKDFVGAVSEFSMMTAISIPVCTLIAINLPIKTLCKKLLRRGAMLCGSQGINQFCDTSAMMVDAVELYPEGSIILNNIKAFNDARLDESCLYTAAVLKEAKSPLAHIFDDAIQESRMVLPDVESVMYEDQLGLVGWVNGDRILVGNRELMCKYNITMPENNLEETYHRQHKQTTFIAHSGVLVAMLITTYRPSIEISKELQRAEYNGISVLISTSDCNITSEQISEDFGIFYRSVKVLPTGLGNVCKEVASTPTERSRAYLATKGKFTQMARALSGCVQMKTNISISIIIQLISIVLGILIMATITLYAGTSILGTVEMLLYILFWGIATVIVPMIKRP